MYIQLFYNHYLPVRWTSSKQVIDISQTFLSDKYLRDNEPRMVITLYEFFLHLEIPGIDKPLLRLVPVREEYAYLP